MDSTDKDLFSKGILQTELFVGLVSSISASSVGVNLASAGQSSGLHLSGTRYGRGEVGEFVLVQGQTSILLGRIVDVRLREPERRSVSSDYTHRERLDAIAQVRLLGSISPHNLQVTTGVDNYPRLTDKVYCAPDRLIAHLPQLLEGKTDNDQVFLRLGKIGFSHESYVDVRPERLFGRHCAILGTTGGGKSWTTARIIEECLKHNSKVILLDATSEYCGLEHESVMHCHLGNPLPHSKARGSISSSLPPESFRESDFIALFEPSGKVQGPKLREAIRSLRLVKLRPNLAGDSGCLEKIDKSKDDYLEAVSDPDVARKMEDPTQDFDVFLIVPQLQQECVYPTAFKESSRWGKADEGGFSYCLSLITRINDILTNDSLKCIFAPAPTDTPLLRSIEAFLENPQKHLLRICLGGLSYEYRARELVANGIGRFLLSNVRKNATTNQPTTVFVDEAHNFLGKHFGDIDHQTRLDSFEMIAKEGRKYGLTLCLATQRPRDIPEGVLSQMGTMIVHRLTNDRDREVVERACGEIDRTVASFLPNLRPGEAAIIGTDFPIPLTVQITPPKTKPKSSGPDFQQAWKHQTEVSE